MFERFGSVPESLTVRGPPTNCAIPERGSRRSCRPPAPSTVAQVCDLCQHDAGAAVTIIYGVKPGIPCILILSHGCTSVAERIQLCMIGTSRAMCFEETQKRSADAPLGCHAVSVLMGFTSVPLLVYTNGTKTEASGAAS